MYSKMLIPLDGSQFSEQVLPYARSLAKGLKIPVELLQVIDTDFTKASSDLERDRDADLVASDIKDKSLGYLGQVADSFADTSIVKCSAETGKPAEVIVDKAAAQTGTLIAMSTHGRSGVQRWLLGSVADKVLHASTSPLLLVRAKEGENFPAEATLKTVLVSLDGSKLAELVLPHTTALAQRMNLEVILLRAPVVPTSAYPGVEYGTAGGYGTVIQEVMEEATQYLEEKVRQLQGAGLEKVSYVLLRGDAPGEIIDMARQTPDNLVAMCTHGRSGVGRWVLGSVTDRVVRYSGDPVLVIRASAEAK
jgi:nucleotide-binding universal stress UspA family protein